MTKYKIERDGRGRSLPDPMELDINRLKVVVSKLPAGAHVVLGEAPKNTPAAYRLIWWRKRFAGQYTGHGVRFSQTTVGDTIKLIALPDERTTNDEAVDR